MVVVDAGARTDRGLASRGVDDGEARSDVVLGFGPVAGLAVVGSTRSEGEIRLVNAACLGGGFTLGEPRVGINRWGDLLPVRLVGCLKDGMADAEGHGEVWLNAPGVLEVVLKFISFEVPVDEGTLGERSAGGRTGDAVVIDIGNGWDGANQVGVGDQVRVIETIADTVEGCAVGREGGGIGWIATEPVGVGGGVGIRVRIGGAVLVNQAPVSSNLDIVVALGPVQVVDDVVDGNTDDGGPSLSGGRGKKAEVDVFAGADTALAVALTDVAVTKVVDQAGGDGPGVAEGHAFRVIDDIVGGGLSGELLEAAGGVLL